MTKNPVLYKALVVGVIALFIGVGFQSVIAVNPNPINEEVYENSNCFVIGRTTSTFKVPSGIFKRTICFGDWDIREGPKCPSQGWIYTKGNQGKWLCEGEFWGKLGTIQELNTMVHYIGINNFYGVSFGGFFYISFFYSFFIGYAKEVRITTQKPSVI